MLKKGHIQFFDACCSPKVDDGPLSKAPYSVTSYKPKKDLKHSLKINHNKSSISNTARLGLLSHQATNRYTLVNQDST